MNDKLYVQYGGGLSAPKGWRNFDASPTLLFERLPVIGKLYTRNSSRFPENVEYGDIVRGLPVKDGSCSVVYCSHVLEHLALDDFRVSLKNTYRILGQKGIFRLVVPDLEFYISHYVNEPSADAALKFMKETSLGKETRGRGLKAFIFDWLGNSRHLWMWDYKAIERELCHVGFREIRRAQYGDSSERLFNEVEDYERWRNCLGVECSK